MFKLISIFTTHLFAFLSLKVYIAFGRTSISSFRCNNREIGNAVFFFFFVHFSFYLLDTRYCYEL